LTKSFTTIGLSHNNKEILSKIMLDHGLNSMDNALTLIIAFFQQDFSKISARTKFAVYDY
tara:strand:+ start:463 stop:642 length:180 start_codon:yes stop_codon:yes gene_type:complete